MTKWNFIFNFKSFLAWRFGTIGRRANVKSSAQRTFQKLGENIEFFHSPKGLRQKENTTDLILPVVL